MDKVYRFVRCLIVEERHQTRRTLNRVEWHALHRQRIVRAQTERCVLRFSIEHLALARLQPVGVDVQILNNYIFISHRESAFACFDHREGCLSNAKSLSKLLLR